ncbi:MAG: response regulator [Pseudomonadota bacterium]
MSKKILVVDDEADIRTFLKTALRKAGYQVVLAENGAEALGIAQAEKPDLITLDLMMPKQSGTDFYRHLQKDAALKKIPVIVISGLSGRHLAVPEPFAVFDKPIDPKEFIDTVERAIGEADAD